LTQNGAYLGEFSPKTKKNLIQNNFTEHDHMIEWAKKPSYATVPLKEVQNVDDAYLKLLHLPANTGLHSASLPCGRYHPACV
jgi:hypothetical protein